MTAKTSDDYKPCVVVYLGGQIRKANVLHVRMDSLDVAREKLRKDLAVWVSYEDYERLQAEMQR